MAALLSPTALRAAFAILVAFYAAVGLLVLNPRTDEPFRRTFVTGEFGAYPVSPFFEGANGLDYRPGDAVDFTRPVARHLLNRFDWIWTGPPGPHLDGWRGRIFLHVADGARRPEAPHRLVLTMAYAADRAFVGRFAVAVNGRDAGGFSCPDRPGPFTFDALLPAGAIGRETYDGITLTRLPEGPADRLGTLVGARIAGFSLLALKLEPLHDP